MSENRKRLIELIEILKLPLTKSEAEEHASKLSDEDVNALISTYEDILNYENAVSESVRNTNPKKSNDLNGEYYEILNKAESKYLENLEKLQEEYDKKASETDKDTLNKVEKSVDGYKQKVGELEDIHDDLYSRLDKVITPQE